MYRSIVVAGSSHIEFANLLAQHLQCKFACVLHSQFANGETHFALQESLRGAYVFIVQTHCGCVNDMLMELLIMIQTCRSAGAEKIIAVLPLFPYARQDKVDLQNAPIAVKLVAKMLETAGVDIILTSYFHSAQTRGFFRVPCVNVCARPLIEQWIQLNLQNDQDLIIVAPDNGAVKRVTTISGNLGVPFALLHKERRVTNAVHDMVLVGDVHNKIAILVDDMADTGHTLCVAADKLDEAGAAHIYAIVVHGVFSGEAVQRLSASRISMIVCTNSLPQTASVTENPKFRVIDILPTFERSIENMLSINNWSNSQSATMFTNDADKQWQDQPRCATSSK